MIIFVMKRNSLGKIVKFLIKMIIPKKYRDNVHGIARDFYSDIRILGPMQLIYVVGLSFISWISHFVQV